MKNIIAPFALIDFAGSVEGGILLFEILRSDYYTTDSDGWIAKSYPNWFAETRLKEYTVRKNIRAFCDRGFLETKAAKVNGNPTIHFRLVEGDPITLWLRDTAKEFISAVEG